jgi:hypothetical protein
MKAPLGLANNQILDAQFIVFIVDMVDSRCVIIGMFTGKRKKRVD